MIGNNEKCLDPWLGLLIILGVCVVILAAIFHEFRGGNHHSRLHKNQNAMAQAAFVNPNTFSQPQAGEITF